MKKRVMSILLCLALALTLLPAAVFAEGETAPTGQAVLGGFRAGGTAGSAYITNNSANSLKILAHKTNASYGEHTPNKRVGDVAILGSYNPKNAMASNNPDYAYDEDGETAIVVETGRRMTRTDKFQPGMTYRFTFCETGHTLFGAPFADYLGELTEDNFTFRTAPGETSPTIKDVESIPQQSGDGSETKGFFYNVYIEIPGKKVSHTVSVADPVTGAVKAFEGDPVTLTARKFNEGKVFAGWEITAGGKTYTHKADFLYYCGLTDFSSYESGSENVTCMFKMGDRDISVKALYSADGIIEFNTVKLNILPPVKDKSTAVAVKPVFGNEGEAYTIRYTFLRRVQQGTTSSSPVSYTNVKTGETLDTSKYRYLLEVCLDVNVDRYKFTENKDGVKFVINGKAYPNEYERIKDDGDDGYPVSYRHLSGVNSILGKYETLEVYIPVGEPNNLNSSYSGAIVPALQFPDPLTATLTVDGGEAKDNQFTIEEGNHTVALNITVPKSVRDRIDDGTVSLVPAVLGLFQDSITGENLWESNENSSADNDEDESRTYIYSASFSNAEAGRTYLPIGAVNLVSIGQEVQYLTGAAASGSVQVTPAKVISGSIVYTDSCRFGKKLTTGVTVTVGGETLAEGNYTYQWQRKPVSGSEADWENIAGADKKQYTPAADDVGKEIRLVVNGTNGYTGMIVGGAKKVEKAVENRYPDRPQLNAIKIAEAYTGFEIVNYNSDCEYVWSLTETPDWNSNKIASSEVNGLKAGNTYNVFVRYKETAITEAGTGVSFNSVTLTDITYLSRLVLSDADGEYAPFGAGNTIYVKAGETKTLNVTKNPGGANSWQAFKFRPYNNVSALFSVENGDIAENAAIPETITIKAGTSVGSEKMVAAYGTNDAYGAWNIVVYAENNIPSFEITNAPTFGDVTLTVGETYQPDGIPSVNAITTRPDGALNSCTLKWEVYTGDYITGAGYPTGNSNSAITVDENGTVTAGAATTADWQKVVRLVATDGSHEHFIASYHVIVTDAPDIPLTGLTMQSKLTMDKGSDFTLTAVKNPVNTTDTNAITWSSSNPAVATVASGTITAVGTGTTTITAACNGKTAVCEVNVIDPTHTHKVSCWSKFSESQHIGSCKVCGAVQYADHTWTKSGTSADESYEYTYYTCTNCGVAKTDVTAKSSTGGSSSGGSGSSSYVITVKDAKNGEVTADRKSASAGTAVTITVKPDSGYVLDDLTVTDAKDKTVKLTDKGNGKYTFTMPSGKVTVEASFSKIKVENPFMDVKPGSYYENAVIWAVGKGITGGTSATTFDPNATCSRAQAVTFLWRAAGSPAPKSTTMPFTDVPSGSYYYDAVLWAVENGITNGTSATTFGPSESCNRAQIVTFLWRAQKSPAATAANPFTDVAADAYYTNAVLWAVKEGVTAGTTAATFSPAADCTRAQIVTFIYRALAD